MDTDRKWVVVRIDGKIAGISTDYRILAGIAARLTAAEKPGKRIGAKTEAQAMTERQHGKGSEGTWKGSEGTPLFNEIKAETVGTEEIWRLRNTCSWDDLMLFGTDFQKKVWRQLWELTHPGQTETGLTHSGATITAKESAEATEEGTSAAEEKAEATEEGTSAAKGGAEAGRRGAEAGRRGQRLISYSDFADLCQNRAGVRAVAHAIGLNPISVVIPCHLVIPKESIDRIMEIKKKAEATIFKGEDLCLATIIKDTSIDFGEYSLGRGLKRELIGMEVL